MLESKEKEVYVVSVAEDGTKKFVKTKIDNYEKIEIGKKNKKIPCLLFKDDVCKIWFCAVETCGTIVNYKKNKTELIKIIKKFVRNEDYDVLCEELNKMKRNCQKAEFEEKNIFFERFEVV